MWILKKHRRHDLDKFAVINDTFIDSFELQTNMPSWCSLDLTTLMRERNGFGNHLDDILLFLFMGQEERKKEEDF